MSSSGKPVLLSGIQPSGQLTLGNYIGAIRNWVNLQESHDCLFSLVDMHAITVRQDPQQLRERCYEFLCLYIACGIDPDANIVFVQSHVPGHAQLAWILNCYTQTGELNRMTQYKDKSRRHADNLNVGLYGYPVLMAADILLYNADKVPVGDDQKQHLELTRDIAQRFNTVHGDLFTIPEPFIPKVGARIMSLQDPESKMSKSDDAETNYVALLDDPDRIIRKIKRAVTDSGSEVRVAEDKPGVSNLINILAAVTDRTPEEIEAEYAGEGYGRFKSDVAEAVVECIRPVQERYEALRADEAELARILASGAERAAARSEAMLKKVYEVVGFVPA